VTRGYLIGTVLQLLGVTKSMGFFLIKYPTYLKVDFRSKYKNVHLCFTTTVHVCCNTVVEYIDN